MENPSTATKTSGSKRPEAAPPPEVLAFLFCSLDGFSEDSERRLNWNTAEPEVFTWNRRRARQAPHIGALLLGRRTYDHFAEFWPSAEAFEHYPQIAAFMEEVPKIVVTTRSDSLTRWQGARPAEAKDLSTVVARMRSDHDGDIAVFGSPSLTAQLLEEGLIDELRILVCPVALGTGTSLFQGLSQRVHLRAGPVTAFPSGNVLLTYTPAHTRPDPETGALQPEGAA